MLPLYCCVQPLQRSKPKPTPSRGIIVPSITAYTLIPSLLIGFVLPMCLMLYPAAPASLEHQKYIAVFQMFPLWIALTQQLLNFVLRSCVPGQWGSKQSTSDQQTVPNFVYASAAAFSGLTHFYFIASVVNKPSLSFSRCFVPDHQAQDFGNQVLVFLKFDYLFTFFTLLLWVYLEFQQVGRHDPRWVGAALLVGSVLVGPGATAAIAWAVREHTLERTGWKYVEGASSQRSL